MKLLKHKHFMSLIYSILVALPFFAILGRVIYTQSNNNSYQSYSDLTLEKAIRYDNSINLIEDNTYQVYVDGNITNTGSVIYYKDISINWADYSISYQDREYIGFNFYGTGTNKSVLLYYSDSYWYSDITTNRLPKTFSIKFNSKQNDNYYNGFYLVGYILSTNKLDNAFEYSLSSFTEENNFGKLDFFSWFSDIFLDTSNSHNMLYINFVNWYMNYTLFISLAYVLFLVLMWFVSFVRRLLENTQNMNIGGL